MLPSINYMTLIFALQAVREGNIKYCNTIGLTLDEMREINKLSLDELFFISKTSLMFIDVSVNHERLKNILIRSRQELQYQQQINRAVRLGASHEILYTYFGLNTVDVAARRRLLGITIPNGRKVIPDENTDARIWLLWKTKHLNNTESLQALDAMMQITEELYNEGYTFSLTVIRSRIKLFENNILKGGG
ncbi:DUF2857 domain-containing protein [Salmonella enterica subsp. diarizonae]|uniref:DUF2857 domain-containing protein n=1 Tax=Salmonella enterica TaxID=28901 RepID=UPI000FA15A64|nr:DUF2857 domain-containing protein [Salmonella enterica subsp. enterica serovar Enteritidis]EAS0547152.1 DUF2857 domain-containing protein [Salmonella enterica]EBV6065800.1 DUF2857 domain-containing protein [Salmonella enterica subsp. enterica serovar Thompson]ECE0793692.1 DUF2857 domain-containing protein [Salmonella enterica subsp. diarizonae]ECI8027689.1 DUF2857 domain-containing protein [Salmonella enterica subsp. enterica serovar Ramatgan]EDO5655855.1 DUF2857 domain-containing protein [